MVLKLIYTHLFLCIGLYIIVCVCNVSSTTTETPCVPSIEHTVKCEKNGEYKVINPQNCAEFYWCKNNTLLVADPQSCAAGSAFNESSGDCDIFRHKVENCLPLKCPTTTVIPTTLSTAPTTGTTFSTTDLTQSTSESSTSTTDSTPLSTWSYSGSSSITTSKTESTSESAASTIDNTEPHTNRSTVSDSTTDNVYTTQSASSRVTNVPSTDFHSTVTADNPIDLTTTAQSQSSSVDSSRRNAGLGLTTTTSPTIRTAGSLSTTFSSHSDSSSDGPINSTAVDIEALTATTKNIGQQNQQNADDTPTDSGSVAGAITGGVLGFAVLCLLIFLVVRWYKRKTHGNYRIDQSPTPPDEMSVYKETLTNVESPGYIDDNFSVVTSSAPPSRHGFVNENDKNGIVFEDRSWLK